MRPPIGKDEVEDLFELLAKRDIREPANWSRRFKNHQEKLKSGDVYQVAEVVRNLSLRDQAKGLSAGEKSMFVKARSRAGVRAELRPGRARGGRAHRGGGPAELSGGDRGGTVRVLTVLADTDRSDPSLGALDLHGALAAAGWDVRTVALGPGRRGGLDHVVPTLSPSPRSPAAVLQLRREQAWADVVVTFGLTAARAHRATRDRGRGSVAVVTHPVAPGAPLGRADRRALAAAAAVVATDDDLAGALDGALGTGRGASSPLVRLALPMGEVPADPEGIRRRAARDALGLAGAGPVLWWLGPGGVPEGLARGAGERGWPVLGGAGGGDGRAVDDELVVAAAEVAVLGAAESRGAPRELLRAASHGQALVASGSVCDGRLVSSATGVALGDGLPRDWQPVLDRLAVPGVRAALGRAARTAARELADAGHVVPGWLELLGRAAAAGGGGGASGRSAPGRGPAPDGGAGPGRG